MSPIEGERYETWDYIRCVLLMAYPANFYPGEFTATTFLLSYFAGTQEVAMILGQANGSLVGVVADCKVYSYSLTWRVPRWNDSGQSGTITRDIYSDYRVVIPFGIYFELATGEFEVMFCSKELPEDPHPENPLPNEAAVLESFETFDQIKALFR